ncbi:MAG: GNAT family N-acetyltransferase [Dokdonella sp.]|nr:GNAT family N-acetyltransferase [Dokdonella sp.]
MDDLACLQANASAATLAPGEVDVLPYPYVGTDGRGWLARAVAAIDAAWAVDVGGAAIGGISLNMARREVAAEAELGYWLGRQHWGQGLMTAIVGTFVPRALAAFGLARMFATVYEGRAASVRVLRKCGFSLESTHMSAVAQQGRALRIEIHAIAGPPGNAAT